jgi:predicted PurR-regulated permease PerM
MTFNTALELTCFLAALFFLSKDKDPVWKLFIPYLLITFLVETMGFYMRMHNMSNFRLYNVFLIVECLFTSFLFFHLYKSYKVKFAWLIGWWIVFAVFYLAEMIERNFANYASFTSTFMSVVFVVACFYFYFLKLKDQAYENLATSAPFLWVSGALFFYFGGIVCNLFFDYLSQNELSSYNHSVRYIIFNILNTTLYTFWIYSFICRYRQRKYSN